MSDGPRDARWTDADADLPSELSTLLRGGRELGSPDEVAELARRLSAVLGPAAGLAGREPRAPDSPSVPEAVGDVVRPSPASLPSGAGSPALGVASQGVLALGGLGAAIAVGVAAFLFLRGPGGADPTLSLPPPSPPATVAPSIPEPAPVAAPAPPQPSEPAGMPADEVALETSDAVASPPPPRAATPRGRARASASRRSSSAGPSETALLEQARGALQSRPAEALQLTRRHQARFPHGALAQEREVIAIEALERLGRTRAAKRRAAEFERRYRGSVHQPRLLRGSDTSAPSGAGSNTPVP